MLPNNALKLTELPVHESGPESGGVQDIRHLLQVLHGKVPAVEDSKFTSPQLNAVCQAAIAFWRRKSMRTGVVLYLCAQLFVTLSCNRLLPSNDPKDMADQIRWIREVRMSESASMTLHTLADVRAGFTVLTCEKGPPYHVTYSSASCAAPGANQDTLHAMFRRQSQVQDSTFKILQRVADLDSSGFVSTPEAFQVKRLIEFGYQFPAILAVERLDTNMIHYRINMNRVELRQTLDEYRIFSGKLVALGLEPLTTIEW